MADPLQRGARHRHHDAELIDVVTFRHPSGEVCDPRTLSDDQAAGMIAAVNARADLPQIAKDLYAVLLTRARKGDSAADKLGSELAAARAKRGAA